MSGTVGIVGSRSLPASFAPLIFSVVCSYLARGFVVVSGGALGADALALSAVVQQGASSRGVIFSAWQSLPGFPVSVRPQLQQFMASGGRVVWGSSAPGASRSVVVSALLSRNRRLVSASSVIVAFMHGASRGTLYTIRQAVSRGVPVVVFLCGGGASVPSDLVGRVSIILSREVI
jgi:predicted Rossmann fold nucleotide-binding protein DprA/Smf involved in DNA uptake